MTTYYFEVILRVRFEGRPMDALERKAVSADTEHIARRELMEHYARNGFQVRRLIRVEERSAT